MKYLLIIIFSFSFLIGCRQKESNSVKFNQSIIDELSPAKKLEDIKKIIQDSIKSKNDIKDSFLDYKFGESKSSVSQKTRKHLINRKLVKKAPYAEAKYKELIYTLKLRESNISFALNFDFTNEDELFNIELRNLRPPESTNYFTSDQLYFFDIVALFKEKYTTKWYYDESVLPNKRIESINYENIVGNRYIRLFLDSGDILINYKNLTLEEKMKANILKSSKQDL